MLYIPRWFRKRLHLLEIDIVKMKHQSGAGSKNRAYRESDVNNSRCNQHGQSAGGFNPCTRVRLVGVLGCCRWRYGKLILGLESAPRRLLRCPSARRRTLGNQSILGANLTVVDTLRSRKYLAHVLEVNRFSRIFLHRVHIRGNELEDV